ncbi:MAG TPA: hypothetical protein PKD19_03280, partial [Candidatus Saccharibacteria bacterium]|nr:hypothetical protein [Candidatus Saccharibacteria bacterium]HMR38743.1 hypothetical protein [Candidatus Saccharibacteria bacterium]
MFIALLGRQPEISVAELSAVYGDKAVRQISPEAALVDSRSFTIADLGGTTKYGEVVAELPSHPKDQAALQSASKYILDHYYKKWRHNEHKTTLGISAYGLKVSASDVQKIGLQLKRFLKKDGASLRLVPTTALALSTAQTLHNHLFSNERKVELIIAKTNDRRIVIAECRGVQNIDAYTKRDHGRPKRDAFVGMLPPKLAQIMINLAVGLLSRPHSLPSPPSSSTPLPSYASLCRSLPSGPVSSPHEAGASWGPRTRSAPTSRKLEVGAAPPR